MTPHMIQISNRPTRTGFRRTNSDLTNNAHERFGMDRLVIRGGQQLNGSAQIDSARNAAWLRMAATARGDGPPETAQAPDLRLGAP
jgi:hypothetical protein